MPFRTSNFGLGLQVILLITLLFHCDRLNDIKMENREKQNLWLKIQTEYEDNLDYIYLVTIKDNLNDSLEISIYEEDLLNFGRHDIRKHPFANTVSIYFYEFGSKLPPQSYFKVGWRYQEVLNAIKTHPVKPLAKYYYNHKGDTIQLY